MKERVEFAAAKLKGLERVFREHGLPLTVQRRVILEELAGRTDHPTAEQLYSAVAGRLSGVSRTTVYRVLETFVRLGIVQRIGTSDSSLRFDANAEAHHHIQCFSCGKVADFDDPSLNGVSLPPVKNAQFEITGYSIQFQGLCSNCRTQDRSPTITSRTRRKNR